MRTRSLAKELIDLGANYYTPKEYSDCLRLLFRLNRLLGVFRSTRRVLRHVPATSSLLDVGCGDGLFLLHLSRYYPHLQLHGMDVSAVAIALAQQTAQAWQARQEATQVSFTQQAELRLNLPECSVDIVLTTLVCHHLEDDELVLFLRNAYQAATRMVIINDLHRHYVAYWFYYCLSPWLFRNRLITHDGLISIQRAFKRADWLRLLARAGIQRYQIQWQFPFRWQVILWKN